MIQHMFNTSGSREVLAGANVSVSANMAGALFLDKGTFIKWIVDTRATNHMIGDHQHLLDEGLIENAGHVQLPTGDSAKVSHVGNYHLGGGDVLINLLCVPAFKFNLMSVPKDLNCCATFFLNCCVLQDLSSGRVR